MGISEMCSSSDGQLPLSSCCPPGLHLHGLLTIDRAALVALVLSQAPILRLTRVETSVSMEMPVWAGSFLGQAGLGSRRRFCRSLGILPPSALTSFLRLSSCAEELVPLQSFKETNCFCNRTFKGRRGCLLIKAIGVHLCSESRSTPQQVCKPRYCFNFPSWAFKEGWALGLSPHRSVQSLLSLEIHFKGDSYFKKCKDSNFRWNLRCNYFFY